MSMPEYLNYLGVFEEDKIQEIGDIIEWPLSYELRKSEICALIGEKKADLLMRWLSHQ